jgi:hypothetical protein
MDSCSTSSSPLDSPVSRNFQQPGDGTYKVPPPSVDGAEHVNSKQQLSSGIASNHSGMHSTSSLSPATKSSSSTSTQNESQMPTNHAVSTLIDSSAVLYEARDVAISSQSNSESNTPVKSTGRSERSNSTTSVGSNDSKQAKDNAKLHKSLEKCLETHNQLTSKVERQQSKCDASEEQVVETLTNLECVSEAILTDVALFLSQKETDIRQGLIDFVKGEIEKEKKSIEIWEEMNVLLKTLPPDEEENIFQVEYD